MCYLGCLDKVRLLRFKEETKLVKDHLTDKDKEAFALEMVKELKKEMAELQADLALPEEEKALLHRLDSLIEVEPSSLRWAFFVSHSLTTGLKLGFLPSEVVASLRRDVPCETDFWVGCISYSACSMKRDSPWEIGEVEKTKDLFERALKDASLPRKIRMASLQLKAWCHVALWEFAEALTTLRELRQTIFTSEGRERVDYLMDYIGRLQDNYLGVEEEDPWHVRTLGEQTLLVKEQGLLYRHDTKFVILPDAEFGEFLPEESGKAGLLKEVPSPSEIVDIIKSLPEIIEKASTRQLLALWHAKEEILERVPVTHTLEATREMLLREYGDWVNKLANQGALINAEFLYKALSARSWGEVIMGYANTVEDEIKEKLLPGLGNFLMKKGTTLENILPSTVESGGSHLGYAEVVLKIIAKNPILTKLLSALPKDTASFLLNELPCSLAELRKLRNAAAHGNFVNAKSAKEMQKLILGTPEKAGLLRRLSEINF